MSETSQQLAPETTSQSETYFFCFSVGIATRRFLFLSSHHALSRVLDQLLVGSWSCTVDGLQTILANEPLDQMSNLDFEVVRVLVRPAEQGRHQLAKVRSEHGRRQANDSHFGEADR